MQQDNDIWQYVVALTKEAIGLTVVKKECYKSIMAKNCSYPQDILKQCRKIPELYLN